MDGADEVDPDMNLIKGRGGAMVQEKILAECAGEFLVIVDDSKLVPKLGTSFPLPVETLPAASASVEKRLLSLNGTPSLRMAEKKDGPVITDQGNFILDVKFPGGFNLVDINNQINSIPGVLGHGLFLDLAAKIIVGKSSGVEVLER